MLVVKLVQLVRNALEVKNYYTEQRVHAALINDNDRLSFINLYFIIKINK